MNLTKLLIFTALVLPGQNLFAGTISSGGDDLFNSERALGRSMINGEKTPGAISGLYIDGPAAEMLYRRLEILEVDNAKSGENIECRKTVNGNSYDFECYVGISASGKALGKDQR